MGWDLSSIGSGTEIKILSSGPRPEFFKMLLMFTGRVLGIAASCSECAVALSSATLQPRSRCKWDMCILTVIAAGRGGKILLSSQKEGRREGGKCG